MCVYVDHAGVFETSCAIEVDRVVDSFNIVKPNFVHTARDRREHLADDFMSRDVNKFVIICM
jgi:hypothetical protein